MPRVKLSDEEKQLAIQRNRTKTLERYYKLREERIARGEIIKRGRPRIYESDEARKVFYSKLYKEARMKYLSEQSQLISCNA